MSRAPLRNPLVTQNQKRLHVWDLSVCQGVSRALIPIHFNLTCTDVLVLSFLEAVADQEIAQVALPAICGSPPETGCISTINAPINNPRTLADMCRNTQVLLSLLLHTAGMHFINYRNCCSF